MKVDFLDILLIILFFQLLSFLPFLFFQKTKKGISNKILGIFLLAKALCISNMLSFRLWDYTYNHFPHTLFFGSSFTILWGPSLYFYIKSLTDSSFRFKKKDFLHIVPFLSHFVYLTFKYHLFTADVKRDLLNSGNLFPPDFWNYFYGLLHIYIFIYTIASLHLISGYRLKIKNSFSALRSVNLSWMSFILYGFILKWIFDVWYYLSNAHPERAFVSLVISRILLFIFINALIYKGLKSPVVFIGVTGESRCRKKSLSEPLRKKYLRRLLNCMENEKPYLNPELTLVELAEIVSIPSRSLSEVINESLNQNFYDFINNYRIKESELLLSDSTSRFKTILEVLFEVGFNSKSSFNTAFKKNTGMTPTAYKRIQSV